jgi:hypothetical protein
MTLLARLATLTEICAPCMVLWRDWELSFVRQAN